MLRCTASSWFFLCLLAAGSFLFDCGSASADYLLRSSSASCDSLFTPQGDGPEFDSAGPESACPAVAPQFSAPANASLELPQAPLAPRQKVFSYLDPLAGGGNTSSGNGSTSHGHNSGQPLAACAIVRAPVTPDAGENALDPTLAPFPSFASSLFRPPRSS